MRFEKNKYGGVVACIAAVSLFSGFKKIDNL